MGRGTNSILRASIPFLQKVLLPSLATNESDAAPLSTNNKAWPDIKRWEEGRTWVSRAAFAKNGERRTLLKTIPLEIDIVHTLSISDDGELVAACDTYGRVLLLKGKEPGQGTIIGLYVVPYEIRAVYWLKNNSLLLVDRERVNISFISIDSSWKVQEAFRKSAVHL